MSRGKHGYAEYIRALEKRRAKKPSVSDEIIKWRKIWRERGPAEFAEHILTCPRDVPHHPELGRVPEFVILADDQKSFLYDLWQRLHTQIILAAGRGAGKTFCIAIYVCWRICCCDDFTVTVMGGSSEQSHKIKEYIDFWRLENDEVNYCLWKSYAPGPQPARVLSRWNSYARFPACSESAARGPHVSQVIIDEVCVGESKSSGGAKAVRGSRGQLTSSPRSLLLYTSTAQYIFGTFFRTWRYAEKMGFFRYRWSTGRHVNDKLWYKEGTKEVNWDYIDTVLIKDRNSDNWISNVWWITTEDIQNYRKNVTDDEFLVEVLGGISTGSGLVFNRNDLREAICKGDKYNPDNQECTECHPYHLELCPMMKKTGLTLSAISNRKMGVDFGDVSPNAMTIVGLKKNIVYFLHSQEMTGIGPDQVLEWIKEKATLWNIYEIFADPEERSMRDSLHLRGYSVPHLWALGGGARKNYYVTKFKRLMEKKRLFIPMAFHYLTESLTELAYDDRGKIRKHNDHSFDSAMYSTADYDPDIEQDAFWKIGGRQLDIWG